MAVLRLALLLQLGWLQASSAAPPPTASCAVHVGPSTGRHVPRPSLGCHLDAGYAHQTKALSAEMVYGPAFTAMPDPPGPNATRVGGTSFPFCPHDATLTPRELAGGVAGLPATASLRQTPSSMEGPKLLRHCSSQLYATKYGEEPQPHPGDTPPPQFAPEYGFRPPPGFEFAVGESS